MMQQPSILPYLLGGPIPPTLSRALQGPSTAQGGVSVGRGAEAVRPDPIRAALTNPPMFDGMNTDQLGQRMADGINPPAPGNLSFEAAPGRKPFGKNGAGWAILGAIGDALMSYGGLQPQFGPSIAKQRALDAEYELRKLERMSPRVEQVGNTVGMLDPTAGTFNPLYTSPSVAGQYALDRGFQPGTPEYQSAVQDYRLGPWSDDAMAAKRDLEGVRYGYRDDLQDQRLDVTRRGQDIRARTSRENNIRSTSTSRSNNIRSNDTRRGAYSYSHGSKGATGNGPVAELNGRKIIVRGGRWVDAETGQPVQ